MGKYLRRIIQIVWGILSNAHLTGFFRGSLYDGPLKRFCVPGMNCYSCPGALGACPIGALSSVLAGRNRKFPFYVLGFLITVGVLVGRFICGWLCLFGLIEELLYKIPTPKLRIPEKADRVLRWLKYLVLAVLVVGLPLFYRDETGTGLPFFCEFLCPVGTLEGGIPLVLLNDVLRPTLGWLFRWKFLILVLCVLSSIFIYRPFCKYLCPLGAFYSLFQRFSLVRLRVDTETCIGCGACSRACGMNVDPHRTPNSAECIRCGECTRVCPKNALSFSVAGKTPAKKIRKESDSSEDKKI
ncbi:MAG: 4Fe-4S binding protein [Clostridia bacterium]|nr:4Fe-4S binding protein [Clostridia bacterium]